MSIANNIGKSKPSKKPNTNTNATAITGTEGAVSLQSAAIAQVESFANMVKAYDVGMDANADAIAEAVARLGAREPTPEPLAPS